MYFATENKLVYTFFSVYMPSACLLMNMTHVKSSSLSLCVFEMNVGKLPVLLKFSWRHVEAMCR